MQRDRRKRDGSFDIESSRMARQSRVDTAIAAKNFGAAAEAV